MGAQQSFILATQLQTHTLAELLENDTFVNSLGLAATKLSRKSRANLQNLVASSRKVAKASSRLKTAKLKPLTKVQEPEISLSSSLDPSKLNAKCDWRRFFWGQVDAEAFGIQGNPASALLCAYKHTFALEKRQPIDRIRWRFYTMFFYDLHCLVNEKINITTKAVQSVIWAIDPSGEHFDEINANIRSWIAKGHRYRNISKSLGGSGCLFLLPESISDYLWEESLPLSGPTHIEAVNRLRSLGIVDKSINLGVDELADNIEEGLLESFRNKTFSDCIENSNKLLQLHQLAATGSAHDCNRPERIIAPPYVSNTFDPTVTTVGSASLPSQWLPTTLCHNFDTSSIPQIPQFKASITHHNTPNELNEPFWLYDMESELG